jgi:hypothetical protein
MKVSRAKTVELADYDKAVIEQPAKSIQAGDASEPTL